MSDRELRELERAASSGDPEAVDRLRQFRELRLGWPRILQAPVEPLEITNKVSAWLSEGFEDTESWLMQFGVYGTTFIVVSDSSLEGALELSARWLEENQAGIFVEPEYDLDDQGNCTVVENNQVCGRDFSTMCTHLEDAEVDLTHTESGWIPSSEWYATAIETPQAIASALSRALTEASITIDGVEQVPQERPLIAYGSFWEALTYRSQSRLTPSYIGRTLHFPNYWNEERVREAAGEVDPDATWYITEPEDKIILTCWVEPGDNPIGDDAEDYARAWSEADCCFDDDADRWLAGARSILSYVNSYMDP